MKPLHLVVIALFTCFSSTLAYAADTAIQQLTLQVPKVLLLDVENTSPNFTLSPPTIAGEGFDGGFNMAAGDKPRVAITSNAGTGTKLCAKAVLQENGNALGNAGLKLIIQDQNGFPSFLRTFSANTSGQVLSTIGNIVTGNVVTSPYQLRLSAGINDSNPMPSYGSHAIEVTYTVTDASCP
jgi:hypothetical protein